MTEKTLKQMGQTVVVRDDGVVHYITHGPANADEARRSMRFMAEHTASDAFTITVVEFVTSDAPDAETRKVIAEEVDKKPSGTIFVGGSFALRTIAKMMMKVMSIVKGRSDPSLFVDTMAEAEASIPKMRAQLAADLEGGEHVRR
jgi:hypothetical protein